MQIRSCYWLLFPIIIYRKTVQLETDAERARFKRRIEQQNTQAASRKRRRTTRHPVNIKRPRACCRFSLVTKSENGIVFPLRSTKRAPRPRRLSIDTVRRLIYVSNLRQRYTSLLSFPGPAVVAAFCWSSSQTFPSSAQEELLSSKTINPVLYHRSILSPTAEEWKRSSRQKRSR